MRVLASGLAVCISGFSGLDDSRKGEVRPSVEEKRQARGIRASSRPILGAQSAKNALGTPCSTGQGEGKRQISGVAFYTRQEPIQEPIWMVPRFYPRRVVSASSCRGMLFYFVYVGERVC